MVIMTVVICLENRLSHLKTEEGQAPETFFSDNVQNNCHVMNQQLPHAFRDSP
jgi:hypothetical protein